MYALSRKHCKYATDELSQIQFYLWYIQDIKQRKLCLYAICIAYSWPATLFYPEIYSEGRIMKQHCHSTIKVSVGVKKLFITLTFLIYKNVLPFIALTTNSLQPSDISAFCTCSQYVQCYPILLCNHLYSLYQVSFFRHIGPINDDMLKENFLKR